MVWSSRGKKLATIEALLERLDEAGYAIPTLKALRKPIAAPATDLFDVLELPVRKSPTALCC